MIYLFEITLQLVLLWLFLTQMAWPILKGERMFPFFHSRPPVQAAVLKVVEELEDLNISLKVKALKKKADTLKHQLEDEEPPAPQEGLK